MDDHKICRSFLILSLFSTSLFAAVIPNTEKTVFPLTTWASRSSAETVSIQNGNGLPIVILITVNAGPNSAGVNVVNCGEIKHISPGSSGICANASAANPVAFSTDNSNIPATGTYQVKQQ